jgi:hypothetical protein
MARITYTYDEDGKKVRRLPYDKPSDTSTAGGLDAGMVHDSDTANLLFAVLNELKKISLQLSIITENTVTNEEID